MLPLELLRVRRHGGRVRPLYLDVERHGGLCRTLIDVFEAHVGLKKGWLESKLEELENASGDFKLVRGLSTLLFRRCSFRVRRDLAVDPKTARRVVFEHASIPPITAEERAEVIRAAASRLGVSPEALEEALWADSDSELVLESFLRPDPAALVAEYNLECARTLVARASRLRVYSGPEWRRVFMLAKRFWLMYLAARDEEGFGLVVEGVGETRGSNLYAERLVSFFDGLLNLRDWRLVAEVPARSGGRRHVFELDSQEALRLGFGRVVVPAAPSFDSEVERRFYYAFRSLNTGWTIERESEPLLAGGEVFIPDFTLKKDGRKVFVEIVGFWTKDYLERKARKLALLRGVDLIVLADKSHSSSKLSEIPGVIFFEGDVPLKPILEFLKRKEGEARPSVVVGGSGGFGDMVDLDELKRRLGGGFEQEYARLLGEGYVAVGPKLVSRRLFEEVSAKIKALGEPTYEAADRVCSQLGLPTQPVLEALGYRVRWLGLDPSKVVVEKASRTG